jgi:hypothetical protein
MADYSSWLDDIVPTIISFLSNQIKDFKKEDSRKRRIVVLIFKLLRAFYLIYSLYTLFKIKFIQKEDYVLSKVTNKMILRCISLILISVTIVKIFKKVL